MKAGVEALLGNRGCVLIARMSCSCLNIPAHLHESASVHIDADGSLVFAFLPLLKVSVW